MPNEEKMSVEVADTMFPGWKNVPILPQLTKLLGGKNYDTPSGNGFYLPRTSQEYSQINSLLLAMLENLPFHNEVGETKLMRSDARKVIDEIITALQGKKSWEDIQWVFTGNLEVFKNLLYPKHNIPTAICYNVDILQSGLASSSNGVIVERFHLFADNDQWMAARDGAFLVNGNNIAVFTRESSFRADIE